MLRDYPDDAVQSWICHIPGSRLPGMSKFPWLQYEKECAREALVWSKDHILYLVLGEAGVIVGNVYLCAHSLGLGATGTTFYDDDVTEFFSPHAEGMSMMFLAAVGHIAEVNRVRPFRSRVGVLLDSLARGAGGARSFTDP